MKQFSRLPIMVVTIAIIAAVFLSVSIGEVASKSTRHEQLIENDCYEHVLLEDGSRYVAVSGTDMCSQIVFNKGY